MSHTTWTGEELQAHLDAWSEQIQRGEKVDISLHLQPSPASYYGIRSELYWLQYGDTRIYLTEMQYDAVLAWKNEHTSKLAKHDGKLDEEGISHVSLASNGWVAVSSQTERYTMMIPPQSALSLLAWLQQERDTLQRLVKEQA